MALNVQLADLSSQFLNFYDQAIAEDATPDRRWHLWKEHYGFAALPPVPEYDEMARQLLDDAWHRYPQIIDLVRAGAGAMEPDPHQCLESVGALLGYEGDASIRVTVFVGGFENNAFAAGTDDNPSVFLDRGRDGKPDELASGSGVRNPIQIPASAGM